MDIEYGGHHNMPKIIISGPTPEFEQAMKQAISLVVDCEINCGYEEVTNGECECWNQKQDEQPGHPEHG
jgi:hypothetical protein